MSRWDQPRDSLGRWSRDPVVSSRRLSDEALSALRERLTEPVVTAQQPAPVDPFETCVAGVTGCNCITANSDRRTTPTAGLSASVTPPPRVSPTDRRKSRSEVPSGYFDEAWENPTAVIDRCRDALEGVEFDGFVATGISGACMVALLAHQFGKTWMIVRKEDDTSNHSGAKAVGKLGKRWIFLDDFVSSGTTRDRVLEFVRKVSSDFGQNHEFVGTLSYARIEPWEARDPSRFNADGSRAVAKYSPPRSNEFDPCSKML